MWLKTKEQNGTQAIPSVIAVVGGIKDLSDFYVCVCKF